MNYVQLLVSGLAIGGIYALLAMSYALVYRSTRAINFAQGDFAALGGYIAFAVAGGTQVGLPSALAGIAGVVVVAVVIERVAFRPLYRLGAIYVIVSSIALVFVLQGVMQTMWGSRGISIDPLIAGSISIGEITVRKQYLVIFGCLILVSILLGRFFRSKVGIAMRASAESIDVAALQGVRHGLMAGLSYAIGGVLTGLAGVLAAPTTLLTPAMGSQIGLIALIAAIVGGLGNFRGALIAGLAVGIIQVMTAYIIGGGFVTMLLFAILVAVLVFKPSGLFGEEGAGARQ